MPLQSLLIQHPSRLSAIEAPILFLLADPGREFTQVSLILGQTDLMFFFLIEWKFSNFKRCLKSLSASLKQITHKMLMHFAISLGEELSAFALRG